MVTIAPRDRQQRLALAASYPFAIPETCFVYENRRHRPMENEEAAMLTEARIPVIACGSNQSPEQLARKYGHFDQPVQIPVQRAWLDDFDIVYSAHITAYGSIAATLQHVPGTRVRVSILWLDEFQLEHMHSTESPGENYEYARLDSIRLGLADGRRLDAAWAYNSLHGCLVEGGTMVALAAAMAEERRLPARSQPQILAAVHRRLAPTQSFDDFVIENIDAPAIRRARIGRLRADASPFAWAHKTPSTGRGEALD